MPVVRALGSALVLCVLTVAIVSAAEWDTIIPGHSTMDGVRAQLGPPTRTASQKTDGYDTAQWIYENGQTPAGMRRVTVDFGLLEGGSYRADLVRSFKLEPKPGAFNRAAVISGWGNPTRIGREGEAPVFFYEEGLFVYFDREGWTAQTLIFTPPQPPPTQGERRP